MTNNPSAAARAQATAAVSAPSVRQAYVDTFRGLLIAHMGLDHASLMFNAGRAAEELAAGPAPMFGDIFQFLTRFTGVPVAPGFFFMAGFMVALTSMARENRGVTHAEVTRRLLIRGFVLIAVDALIMGLPRALMGFYSFMVLTCIGVGIIATALLRDVSSRILMPVALAILLLHPLLDVSWLPVPLHAMLYEPVREGAFRSLYPVIPWIAVLLLGFVVGRDSMQRERPAKLWASLAALSFAFFIAVRLYGGYGNAYCVLQRRERAVLGVLEVSARPAVPRVVVRLHLPHADRARGRHAQRHAEVAAAVRGIRPRAVLLLHRALLRARHRGGDPAHEVRPGRNVCDLAVAALDHDRTVRVVLPQEARAPELDHALYLTLSFSMRRRHVECACGGADRSAVAFSSANAAEIPADLAKAVQDYDEAQVHGNGAELQRLVADDYTLVNSSGRIQNKAELIADYTTPGYKIEPFEILEPVEKVWSDGAVMGGVVNLRGTDGGKPFAVTLRFADIWAKRNGKWQVVYTHVSRPPTKGA